MVVGSVLVVPTCTSPCQPLAAATRSTMPYPVRLQREVGSVAVVTFVVTFIVLVLKQRTILHAA